MDVEVDREREILVNNRTAGADTLIYENFTVDWTVHSYGAAEAELAWKPVKEEAEEKQRFCETPMRQAGEGDATCGEETKPQKEIVVMINGKPVRLTGKAAMCLSIFLIFMILI